jgi:hypothetical protein
MGDVASVLNDLQLSEKEKKIAWLSKLLEEGWTCEEYSQALLDEFMNLNLYLD